MLGNSIQFTKLKGRGLQLPWKTEGRPGSSMLGGEAEAGAAGLEDGIDFTTQPAQFKVRGLLSLPPLKMLQGQALPTLQFSAYGSSMGQRPSTANSMTSIASRN